MSDAREEPQGKGAVDSRRWTGPEPGPVPPPDRRAARAAFRAAGGPGAGAPQRAASAVSLAGLAAMVPVLLLGAGPDAWPGALAALGARARAGLEGWLAPSLGPKGAEGLAGLLGDPRPLAAGLAVAGTLAGMLAARRHRAALARGFAAAEAGGRGTVFTTAPPWGAAAPVILFLWGMNPPGGPLFAANALALWLLARLTASGLVSVAERRAAGLGAGGPAPSGWDAATVAVALGAMLLLLARALGVLG